jgi:hypothetical protein
MAASGPRSGSGSGSWRPPGQAVLPFVLGVPLGLFLLLVPGPSLSPAAMLCVLNCGLKVSSSVGHLRFLLRVVGELSLPLATVSSVRRCFSTRASTISSVVRFLFLLPVPPELLPLPAFYSASILLISDRTHSTLRC